jgi:hypothetical protein
MTINVIAVATKLEQFSVESRAVRGSQLKKNLLGHLVFHAGEANLGQGKNDWDHPAIVGRNRAPA